VCRVATVLTPFPRATKVKRKDFCLLHPRAPRGSCKFSLFPPSPTPADDRGGPLASTPAPTSRSASESPPALPLPSPPSPKLPRAQFQTDRRTEPPSPPKSEDGPGNPDHELPLLAPTPSRPMLLHCCHRKGHTLAIALPPASRRSSTPSLGPTVDSRLSPQGPKAANGVRRIFCFGGEGSRTAWVETEKRLSCSLRGRKRGGAAGVGRLRRRTGCEDWEGSGPLATFAGSQRTRS
jgi:hypothetical protein